MYQDFGNGNAEGVRQIQPRTTPWVRRNALLRPTPQAFRETRRRIRRCLDTSGLCELLQSSLFLFFAVCPGRCPGLKLAKRLRRWLCAFAPCPLRVLTWA